MMNQLTRLSPQTRLVLRVVGVAIVVVALGLIAFGFNRIFLTDSGVSMSDPGWFDAEQEHAKPGTVALFIGMPLLALGGWIVWLAFLKPLTEIVATETGGAVEYGAGRAGRGFGAGLKQAGALAGVVKVRCRGCGFLDSEDARFCSGCGQAM